ncbi:MAG: hypothetical protein M4579_002200 [Chaenotheca gracillima]|nr:MAG: hypothetical protein M4579_002200 [Chaenotheca gracillima]
MVSASYILGAVVAAACGLANAQSLPPKSVFAHYMVGNAGGYTADDWTSDIQAAQAAHIDGFALNIGAGFDNDPILTLAYDTANSLNFKLFLSFDYLGGPDQAWVKEDVVTTINNVKGNAAQFNVDGLPLVSTFEGVDSQDQWSYIKSQVPIYFMPEWSLDPATVASNPDVDGAFTWNAWPQGASDMSDSPDLAWKSALGAKPYMMPVSPWFFTSLPQYNKNWIRRGDDLWYDRWQQVLEVQPQLVEIITWNDYGESHYIGPIRDAGIVPGAEWYVDNMPHDNWRDTLPYWIDAFKNGATTVDQEKLTFWYRETPKDACPSGGTVDNDPGSQGATEPTDVEQDEIFIDALVSSSADITVQIGDGAPTPLTASKAGVNHFSVPFNGQTGPVSFTMTRNGAPVVPAVTGPDISTTCPSQGTNWNAYVGGNQAHGDPVNDLSLQFSKMNQIYLFDLDDFWKCRKITLGVRTFRIFRKEDPKTGLFVLSP